ncbi:inosine/xanthosine triphosphatase [Nanoarchaeota archaeon]
MKITLGSTNKVKLEALRETIERYDFLKGGTVEGVKASSGVEEQPMDLHDIVQGAINRAKNAFEQTKPDLAFGIESGFMTVPNTKTGYIELSACAIFDGKQIHLGLSPGFECPPKAIELVKQGMDLSQACKQAGLTDSDNLGQEEGIIGVLTKGRKTRKDYTVDSIIMALVHLENSEIY